MLAKKKILTFRSTVKTDVFDLTSDVRAFVRTSGISEGQLIVFIPGSTAAVTTIEYETGVVEDLIQAIERLIPSDISYRHNLRWGDGNGYSHVRAAFLKPSLSVPVWGGEVILGTWQQIVLIDFDNKPRQRQVVLHLMGS
ncbi:MAG: YjbQ family protein [Deltaproteobacteria bacterium]|nr:MAG: YjbQ family protein [Deltaproteobacteria bacterium]